MSIMLVREHRQTDARIKKIRDDIPKVRTIVSQTSGILARGERAPLDAVPQAAMERWKQFLATSK